MPEQIELTIDGRPVQVDPGTSIYDAARLLGIQIPKLCHAEHQTPVGVCRVCTVDVQGGRVLAASCVRPAEKGMIVQTNSERVLRARKMLYEILLSDHPVPCTRQQHSHDCELETYATQAGLTKSRFAPRPVDRGTDDTSVIIKVDHAACILCDRCIRGCGEIKKNFIIGRNGKGSFAGIGFDNDQPMGHSNCVGCGECMVSCPTGALTNKSVLDVEIPRSPQRGDAELTADELLKLPFFKGASGTFLELNHGSVVKRRFKRGDVICQQGDFGATAFYVLSGKVEVRIDTRMGHVKSRGQGTGGLLQFFSRITGLASATEDPRDQPAPTHIPVDGPVDLPYGNPVATLGPGDLFGEMTCMSYYPRSATVVALEDVEALEMLRNVLYMLQKNKTFKAELDKRYKQRALDTHLRSVPIFAGLTKEFIDGLRDRVELIRFEPGQVICRQGEPADSFYLIRIGFVKVTQSHPGGEMVLAYLARGGYFGEIGLLAEGVRTATCAALDHVEVVRIQKDDFQAMVERFPNIKTALTREARHRLEQNDAQMQRVSTVQLDDFLGQGLMEAQSLLLLDLERCTRCDQCVRACAAAHDGVTRLVRDGLRFDKYLVATSCRSCRDPLCMVGCPVGSIRRRDSLEIVIEDWCIGCGLCANQCPYGNINLHPFEDTVPDPEHPGRKKVVARPKATTCDLSAEYHEPACVYACPHGAAQRVEPLTFFGDRLGLRT
jgi:CRP-like cAMP-binding protein/Fe-S-cluster-containing hydrogenase component 2